MRQRVVLASIAIAFCSDTAAAQTNLPRFYASATTAVDGGTRGNIPGGAVPSAGALFGVRFADAWSLEFEAEHAFRTTTAGSGEATLLSFPPNRNPTREEIEAYGIRTRDERKQTAGNGWSAHVMWRSREAGRVNVGLLTGLSARAYQARLDRRTTWVSPLLNLPATYKYPDEVSSRTMTAGGLTGGVVVFVRVTDSLSIAPEFRVTWGLITDDPYRVFKSGVRVMWGF